MSQSRKPLPNRTVHDHAGHEQSVTELSAAERVMGGGQGVLFRDFSMAYLATGGRILHSQNKRIRQEPAERKAVNNQNPPGGPQIKNKRHLQ